jgi:hypothetical protein
VRRARGPLNARLLPRPPRPTRVDRRCAPRATGATDSDNVRVVFNACKDIILKANLEASGFM